MDDYKHALQYYAASRLDGSQRHVSFVVSGADVSGEGELKMMDIMIEQALSMPKADTHVLVGNDADLIVMDMGSLRPNVYVMSSAASQEYSFFSTSQMGTLLKQRFGSKACWLDFVLLSILAGNDYIPKLSGVGLPTVWNAYEALRGSLSCEEGPGAGALLTSNGQFHWPSLVVLLEALAKDENPAQGNETADKPRVMEPKSAHRVEQYLSGILWNVDMYVNGQCCNQVYTYPHSAAPSPSQILRWCLVQKEASGTQQWPLVKVPHSDGKPMSLRACLFAVLPRAAKALLPKPLQDLTESPKLTSLFEGTEDCEKCNPLRSRWQSCISQVRTIRDKIKEAEAEAMQPVLQNPNNQQPDLSELQEQLLKSRFACRVANSNYFGHRVTAHTIKPVPWDDLIEAVDAIPDTQFSDIELQNMASSEDSWGMIIRHETCKTPLPRVWRNIAWSDFHPLPKQPSLSMKQLRSQGLVCAVAPPIPRRRRQWCNFSNF